MGGIWYRLSPLSASGGNCPLCPSAPPPMLTALPSPLAGGRGLLPPPQEPPPLSIFGLRSWHPMKNPGLALVKKLKIVRTDCLLKYGVRSDCRFVRVRPVTCVAVMIGRRHRQRTHLPAHNRSSSSSSSEQPMRCTWWCATDRGWPLERWDRWYRSSLTYRCTSIVILWRRHIMRPFQPTRLRFRFSRQTTLLSVVRCGLLPLRLYITYRLPRTASLLHCRRRRILFTINWFDK